MKNENLVVEPEKDNEIVCSDDVTLAQTDTVPAPDDTVLEPVCAEPAPVCDEPIVEPQSNTDCGVGSFFGTIQECITITWRYHLKTRKHFVHTVLNEFYEKALDIVDDIIEQYQGINGIVEEPFTNCVFGGDGYTEVEYLNSLKMFVKENKYRLGDNSEIDSTIDEFLALIDSTVYKLSSFNENKVKSFEEFVYEEYDPDLAEEE